MLSRILNAEVSDTIPIVIGTDSSKTACLQIKFWQVTRLHKKFATSLCKISCLADILYGLKQKSLPTIYSGAGSTIKKRNQFI
jgi:hypothetical protein